MVPHAEAQQAQLSRCMLAALNDVYKNAWLKKLEVLLPRREASEQHCN